MQLSLSSTMAHYVMAKQSKIYTWQGPERADFETQLSSFMALSLLNDSPVSKQIRHVVKVCVPFFKVAAAIKAVSGCG
jgi:hypothetical protein